MKTIITILCWFIPIKHIRKRLKYKYVNGTPIRYTNDNEIILHTENGRIVKNPYMIHGLKVRFAGKHSRIELFEPIKFHNCSFNLKDDCLITVHGSYGINNTIIDMYHQSSVFIDENVGIGGVHIHMMNERGTSVHIGRDVVMSYDIVIYTTDTHPVLDMNGNIINNKKSSVVIGNHTWICASAVLLKGAQIANDCIVGNSAVISSGFKDEHVVIAGNPAKVIKRDINWDRGKID